MLVNAQIDSIELRLGCLSAGDGLQIFRRLNQRASAGDGLALNRLAMARNGGGLQVYRVQTPAACRNANTVE